MRRYEVGLAVGVNAIVGAALCAVTHAYAVEGDAVRELGALAIVILVALFGLGVAGLAFLAWLKH
jgi:hypothetical protein